MNKYGADEVKYSVLAYAGSATDWQFTRYRNDHLVVAESQCAPRGDKRTVTWFPTSKIVAWCPTSKAAHAACRLLRGDCE